MRIYKRKINEFHGVEEAANEVVIFANPCTLQIVSKHWTDVIIKSPAKKTNAPLIKKYTGIKDYKGRADQIDEIMKYVTKDNYDDMKYHISKMGMDETTVGSTNFYKLISDFGNADTTWMAKVNQILES